MRKHVTISPKKAADRLAIWEFVESYAHDCFAVSNPLGRRALCGYNPDGDNRSSRSGGRDGQERVAEDRNFANLT